MLQSFAVTVVIFVDAQSADEAEQLVAGLALPFDDENEIVTIYTEGAILTGYEISDVSRTAPSGIYDEGFLAELAAA